MKLSILFARTLIAVAFIAASTNVAMAQFGSGSNALLGTWKVTLTPDTGAPPFDELMTFTDGGGIVESNNFPFFEVGLSAGPGQGSWSYAGRQRFPFTFVKFLYLPTGQGVGMLKVAGTITYSPTDDTWSGPATVSICDNQISNCVTQGVTDGRARRLVAAP